MTRRLHLGARVLAVRDVRDARARHPGGTAKGLVELARSLKDLPLRKKTFEKGEITWTKARTVARVAIAETEAKGIGRASVLSSRGLEDESRRSRARSP